MQEVSEPQSWLEFFSACSYLDKARFEELDKEYENIIGMLSRMEGMADKSCYAKK
jgi:four helix bundle protein